MDAINKFIVDAAPALKAAFLKAFKVAAYIILSTALAAVAAYVAGDTSIDTTVVFVINAALAAATKFISVLKED